MREIKFRGKDIKTGEWVYGGYYKHLNRTPCPIGDSIKEKDYICLIIKSGFSDWNMPKPVDCFEVDEKSIGQYTGLKDKNGKQIYEGDIVEADNCNPKYEQVEFIEGGFCLTNPLIKGYPMDINTFYPSLGCLLTVIGNIYENPELLNC